MSASPYGRGLIGLLKRGWVEIPSVMGASVMGLIGLAIGSYASYEYSKKGVYEPKYKKDYVVYRSDDPRCNKPVRAWMD